VRRDDHLAGPKHPQAVGEGDDGIRVSDHAVRVDALAREGGERSLQTPLGTNAGAVLVREPVPQAAVQRRADDEDLNRAQVARSTSCSRRAAPSAVSFAITRIRLISASQSVARNTSAAGLRFHRPWLRFHPWAESSTSSASSGS
jgi:hypothetical protein